MIALHAYWDRMFGGYVSSFGAVFDADDKDGIARIPVEMVSKDQRDAAKPVNYGAVYGIGAATLAVNAFAAMTSGRLRRCAFWGVAVSLVVVVLQEVTSVG